MSGEYRDKGRHNADLKDLGLEPCTDMCDGVDSTDVHEEREGLTQQKIILILDTPERRA